MVKIASVKINMTLKNRWHNSFLASATVIKDEKQEDQEVSLQSKLMQQAPIMSLLTKYMCISKKAKLIDSGLLRII